MHYVVSQHLLVNSIVHEQESSSVIGDADARHVAMFCVSITVRTLRDQLNGESGRRIERDVA